MNESYNSTQSGKPRAAIAATALLLAATTTLAFWLSQTRGLGEVVAPANWAISFRPPDGWVSQGWQNLSLGERGVFAPEGEARAASRQSLTVTRIQAQEDFNLEQIVLMAGLTRIGVGMMEPQRASLGPLPGLRYANVNEGRIMYVGLHETRDGLSEAYIFFLQRDPPNPQRDFALADAVARSVEFAPVAATDASGGEPSTDRG